MLVLSLPPYSNVESGGYCRTSAQAYCTIVEAFTVKKFIVELQDVSWDLNLT